MQKNSNINLDKIALFEVQSYKINHKIKNASNEITQTVKFDFSSEVGAKAFYQQYQEKFIPLQKDDDAFKQQPTFDIKKPIAKKKTKKEEQDSSYPENPTWIVKCSCSLNQENLYGHIFDDYGPMPSSTEKTKTGIDCATIANLDPTLDFLNCLNSYFDIPNINNVELIPALNKTQDPDKKDVIHYKNKQVFESTRPYSPKLRPLSPSPDPEKYQIVGTQEGIIFDDGEEHMQLEWPFQRRYRTDYVKLLIPQTKETLQKKPRQDDFLAKLPQNPKIIELGAGAGFGARDIKELRPDATVIAVGVTPLFEENIPYCDQIYYASIPNNLALLKDHFGTADLVIDVFGAHTYAHSVRDAAIYAACLLKEGGKFKSVISGLDDSPHTPDSCPLGSGIDRHELIQFFKEHLGIDLVIKKTMVESKLKPGKIVEDFYLEFTKTSEAKPLIFSDFARLCKLAEDTLGIPHEIDVSSDSDYGKFKSQAIRSIGFFKPESNVTKIDSYQASSCKIENALT